MRFSVIIPVYNRPEEVDELLGSLAARGEGDIEVIVVEDGSRIPCGDIVAKYTGLIDIGYFEKENTGPGLTRNYGAQKAKGNWLVFFDSDCIIPPGYFAEVEKELDSETTEGWGGPDRAAETFTPIQKAIDYAMTSFLTTGGIRGRKKRLDRFYARSFNMGIRRDVFEKLGGFSPMRVGEDIDLGCRLFANGYNLRLFPEAWVYHKRRATLGQFYRQVHSFGKARVALSRTHPGTLKPVHTLPALFVAGLAALFVASIRFPWLPLLPAIYFAAVLVESTARNRCLSVGLLSVPAAFIELWGYGTGFIRGLFARNRNRSNRSYVELK